jgi:hypothetical protein
MSTNGYGISYDGVAMVTDPADPEDVYLGYCGGSGGFILLHLLLASGEFYVDFGSGINFGDVMHSQWRIQHTAAWKNQEQWPHNWHTIWGQDLAPRIYFFCNPTLKDYFDQPQDYMVRCYHGVKDPAWPDIHGFQDYQQLCAGIRQECEIKHGLAPLVRYYTNPKKFVWIYTDIHSQNELSFLKKAGRYYQRPDLPKLVPDTSVTYGDDPVDPEAAVFLQACDLALRLQDVLNEPDILVDRGLISAVNSTHKTLISRWISLHPPDLMRQMGIALP